MKSIKKLNKYLLSSVILSILIVWFSVNTNASFISYVFKRGRIAGKGLVLKDDKPFWVEYSQEGEVLYEINADPNTSTIMSVDTYCSYLNEYETIASIYDNIEIVSASNYTDQPLKKDTQSVVIKRYNNPNTKPLLLLEAPINLNYQNKSLLDPNNEYRSLILDSNGKIQFKTANNYGYHVAVYAPIDGSISSKGLHGLDGYKNDGQLCAPIKGATFFTGMGGKSSSDANGEFVISYMLPPCPGFVMHYPDYIHASIYYQRFNPKNKYLPGIYRESKYIYDVCNGLSVGAAPFNIGSAMMRVGALASANETNSLMSHNFIIDIAMLTGKAYLWNEARSGIDINPDIIGSVSSELETEYDSVKHFTLNVEDNIHGTISIFPAGRLHDEGIEVAIVARANYGWRFKEWSTGLTGNANPTSILMDEDKTVSATYEKIPDNFEGKKRSSSLPPCVLDVEIAGEGIVLADPPGIIYEQGTVVNLNAIPDSQWKFLEWQNDLSGNSNPQTVNMDTDKKVVAVFTKKFSEQGLLKGISREDLENSDIYVFRMSTGLLFASQENFNSSEVNHNKGGECFIAYKMTMRGPDTTLLYKRQGFSSWQKSHNINLQLRGIKADHLRVGEDVKIIIINRATGYIGSSIAKIGHTSKGQSITFISFSPEKPVIMRPPNLKIIAERKYIVQSGITKGEERKYLIGSEGSGLTSDEYVVISTEWHDWDGSPLPEKLPGYTGRLAVVVDGNVKLQSVGIKENKSSLDNFEIKP